MDRVAARFQPQLGHPWFEVFGWPVYQPPAFFWWWFAYDAYAPRFFVEGRFIAASGGFAAIVVAVACRSGARAKRRGPRPMVRPDGPTRRRFEAAGSLIRMASCSAGGTARIFAIDGPEHVLCFAPTRSGKGVGLVVPTLLTWPGSAHRSRHQGRELDAHRGLARAVRPRAAVRSDQSQERRLQSIARGPSRRMGGPRRPERRRRPGRSRRRAGAAQSLGEDQPFAPGRRHPACSLRRAGQDARRRRQFPLRSEAPDRGDAARDDDDGASRRARRRIRSSPAPRASF